MAGVTLNAGGARYFDLSGGETAGEVLFRMRVNSADEGVGLTSALVDRDGDFGLVTLDYVADGQWRDYSVKIADVLASSVLRTTPLTIDEVADIFDIGASGGSVNLDVDDISVRVACRDNNGCEATPRSDSSVPATVVYTEDFEALDQDDQFALGGQTLGGGAGFIVFASVWDGAVGEGIFQYQYGPNVAPNGGAGFAAIAGGAFSEAGPEQGFAVSEHLQRLQQPGPYARPALRHGRRHRGLHHQYLGLPGADDYRRGPRQVLDLQR